ncbi:hypothetical protein PR048_027783 [Dryococelus australis]|uniref:Uncharacterized protein n=1 Tax=Dryococelus australis TaxID=614101 RepID=A0ABQ9GHI8_9NEOP|nr:hypothetical protein PR048_027783 [Dryococelus australis]
MEGRGEREIPEKLSRTKASSSTIPTSENLDSNPLPCFLTKERKETTALGRRAPQPLANSKVSRGTASLSKKQERGRNNATGCGAEQSQLPAFSLRDFGGIKGKRSHDVQTGNRPCDLRNASYNGLLLRQLTRLHTISVQTMSRQSQCSRAPSRTVGFTRRFHTLSSIQATNTSLAVVPQSPVVVYTSLNSRTLTRRPPPMTAVRWVAAVYIGLRPPPKIFPNSRDASRRAEAPASERRSATPASLAAVGIHGIPRWGIQEAASASFQEEGRARWVSDYGAGLLSRRQLQHVAIHLLTTIPNERASKSAHFTPIRVKQLADADPDECVVRNSDVAFVCMVYISELSLDCETTIEFYRRLSTPDASRHITSLDCSPPTKANRIQSLSGSLPDFRKWELSERCHWLTGFLGELQFPPPLHSGAVLFSSHFTLIDSQYLVVTSCPHTSANIRSHVEKEPPPKDISEIDPNRIICWKTFPVHEGEADNTADERTGNQTRLLPDTSREMYYCDTSLACIVVEIKAVHDNVSTLEMNLRKKSLTQHPCNLMGAKYGKPYQRDSGPHSILRRRHVLCSPHKLLLATSRSQVLLEMFELNTCIATARLPPPPALPLQLTLRSPGFVTIAQLHILLSTAFTCIKTEHNQLPSNSSVPLLPSSEGRDLAALTQAVFQKVRNAHSRSLALGYDVRECSSKCPSRASASARANTVSINLKSASDDSSIRSDYECESKSGCEWSDEVSMEQRRNEGAGEMGDPRENPPTSGIIDESEIQNHEISLAQHFYIGTKIKLDPGSELGSFDLRSGKMLVQPGIRRGCSADEGEERSQLSKSLRVRGRVCIALAVARLWRLHRERCQTSTSTLGVHAENDSMLLIQPDEDIVSYLLREDCPYGMPAFVNDENLHHMRGDCMSRRLEQLIEARMIPNGVMDDSGFD